MFYLLLNHLMLQLIKLKTFKLNKKVISKFLYVSGTLGIIAKAIILTKIGGVSFLGTYTLIISLIVPIGFIIGNAREIKIISLFLNNKDFSFLEIEMYNLIKSSIILFFIFSILYWASGFYLIVYIIFFFSNLSLIYLGSILRVNNEFNFSCFIFFKMLFTVVFCFLAATQNELYYLAFSDILLVYIFSRHILIKIKFLDFKVFIPNFSNFSTSYFSNSLVTNVDKIIVSLISIELLGIYSLILQFISASIILNGIISNYFILLKIKIEKKLSIIGFVLGLLCLILIIFIWGDYVLILKGFEFFTFNLELVCYLGLIFLFSILNFTEYYQIRVKNPFMIFEQNMIYFICFILILYFYKPQTGLDFCLIITYLYALKYVIFILLKTQLFNYNFLKQIITNKNEKN